MKNLPLYLYNAVTKRKDHFLPDDLKHARMYICGPTVYQRPHIGNIRVAVTYDLLYRLLKFIFPKVTYVMNITDVDDKIIDACKANGMEMSTFTEDLVKAYEEDTRAVMCLPPDHFPRATDNIKEMISMIQKLLDNGHAYIAQEHVLFKIDTYPKYGSLSRRTLDEMIAGARVEVAEFKENPADFVLWKPAPQGEDKFCFDSPWGRGRPGWHIECSAMSTKYLGKDFEIHGGGIDLMFPHHENEIAQAVCANKGSSFARVWLHNGFLTVDGEKMSKSANNVILLNDLINDGVPGIVMRYFYFMTHYRKPLDYNKNALHLANKGVMRMAKAIEPLIATYDYDVEACDADMEKALLESNGNEISDLLTILCNDLNTQGLFANMFSKNSVRNIAMVTTLLGFKPSLLYQYKNTEIDPEIIDLANERERAKLDKDWLIADALRDQVLARGYSIMDQKDGTYKLIKL
jgi:cysteinyl-tRNA synthetase